MAFLRTHYVEELRGMNGKEVTLAGWAHEVRDVGKLRFVLLRDRTGIVQITAKRGEAPDAVFELMSFPKETVIRVRGIVKEGGASKAGLEIMPSEAEILNPITTKIPFELTGKVPADIDVRLDNRYVDLRRLETQAIFRIRSELAAAFREKLTELKFQEVSTPCIVAAATEGGTDLFPVQYFEKQAFLAQSPQLYKQLAVIGGMDRVFMTMPVFRAEKHNTVTHLNEITQMDAEMGFCDHEGAMDVLEAVFLHMLERTKYKCKAQLETVKSDILVPDKIVRHTYSSLVELLNKNGVDMKIGDDFTKENERKMGELLGEEAFFITEWPTKIKAFYAMPVKEKPELCNAFDLMYRGLEICSGTQRNHLPYLLVKQIIFHGINPANFEFYVNAFRMGAPPHAGWSIGLERMAMQVCRAANIRECALFPRDRHRLTP
ncbi:Aspartate--tRNA(Asp/Asn) ligase [Candidatus Burarchaeum australiense]|nr:Aspartate--tRNA(Asp/Asn) ligase [Candidatus Burarchaeum australiense]